MVAGFASLLPFRKGPRCDAHRPFHGIIISGQIYAMSQRPWNDLFLGWGQQSQQTNSSQRPEEPAGPPAKKQRQHIAGATTASVVVGNKAAVAPGAVVSPQQIRAGGQRQPHAEQQKGGCAGGGGGAFVAACPLEDYAEAWLKLTLGKGIRCQTLSQMQANALKPSELRAVAQVHGLPASLGETRNKAELLERLAGTELVNPFAGCAAAPKAGASPPPEPSDAALFDMSELRMIGWLDTFGDDTPISLEEMASSRAPAPPPQQQQQPSLLSQSGGALHPLPLQGVAALGVATAPVLQTQQLPCVDAAGAAASSAQQARAHLPLLPPIAASYLEGTASLLGFTSQPPAASAAGGTSARAAARLPLFFPALPSGAALDSMVAHTGLARALILQWFRARFPGAGAPQQAPLQQQGLPSRPTVATAGGAGGIRAQLTSAAPGRPPAAVAPPPALPAAPAALAKAAQVLLPAWLAASVGEIIRTERVVPARPPPPRPQPPKHGGGGAQALVPEPPAASLTGADKAFADLPSADYCFRRRFCSLKHSINEQRNNSNASPTPPQAAASPPSSPRPSARRAPPAAPARRRSSSGGSTRAASARRWGPRAERTSASPGAQARTSGTRSDSPLPAPSSGPPGAGGAPLAREQTHHCFPRGVTFC